jgi:hypothetical protein
VRRTSTETKWSATTHQRHIAVGLFSVYQIANDTWKAIRVWTRTPQAEPEIEPLGIYASAKRARAACDTRIAALESAELALPSEPTTRVLYSCEQLEANRPLEVLR